MNNEALELIIPFKTLVNNGLTFEEWFILYSVYANNKDIMEEYIEKCGKINTSKFIQLKEKGLINLNILNEIRFPEINLTYKSKDLFFKSPIVDINIEFEDYFKELRDTYPNKVPAENGSNRRLQGDINRCKKLYYKILIDKSFIDKDLHNNIIKAIKKQYLEYERGKRLVYFQNLVTYLHQQNYEAYLEDMNEELKEFKFDEDI